MCAPRGRAAKPLAALRGSSPLGTAAEARVWADLARLAALAVPSLALVLLARRGLGFTSTVLVVVGAVVEVLFCAFRSRQTADWSKPTPLGFPDLTRDEAFDRLLRFVTRHCDVNAFFRGWEHVGRACCADARGGAASAADAPEGAPLLCGSRSREAARRTAAASPPPGGAPGGRGAVHGGRAAARDMARDHASRPSAGFVARFLAANFYDRSLEELQLGSAAAVRSWVGRLEEAAGGSGAFQQGDCGRDFAWHTTDRMALVHQPFVLFVAVAFVDAVTGAALRLLGFRLHGRDSAMPYWHRPARKGTSHRPVVILHGLGGLAPYLLIGFPRLDGRELVLPVFPQISIRVLERPVTPDETAEAIEHALARHGLVGARAPAFVAHSFGTFVLSRVLQRRRVEVERAVAIDPVAIGLAHPHLVQTVCYDKFGLDFFRRFLLSGELGVATALTRNFNWSAMQLWPDDFPPNLLVMLAANDFLLPTDTIVSSLAVTTAKVHLNTNEAAMHGMHFLSWFDPTAVAARKRLWDFCDA